MKILIIGGMGVIGGAISEAAAMTYDVWVLSRRKPFEKWKTLPVHYLQGDWKDNSIAKNVVSKNFDVIIDTQIFDDKQLKRSADIVNGHCKQFIYISTDSVYPHPSKNVVEDDDIIINNVKWKYGYDKLKGEVYLKKHSNEYGFSWTIIRPTITFGDTRIPVGFSSKRNTFTIADRMINQKPILRFDDPKTKHSLCHVSLFGEVVVSLFLDERAYSQCFHISDDVAYSYDEIFKCIERSLGVKGIYVHTSSKALKKYSKMMYEEMIYDKDPEFILDNHKIKKLCPNINFSIDLDSVIERTINNLERIKKTEQDKEYDIITDLILLKQSKGKADQSVINYVNGFSVSYIQELKKYDRKCGIHNYVNGIKWFLRPIKQMLKKLWRGD